MGWVVIQRLSTTGCRFVLWFVNLLREQMKIPLRTGTWSVDVCAPSRRHLGITWLSADTKDWCGFQPDKSFTPGARPLQHVPGNTKLNVVPWPTSLSTRISPPCA